MKILLIGSGGREHAIALQLSKSSQLTQLYTAPGNPGTEEIGQNVSINENDHEGLLIFAKENNIDITVVGPEGPLANGIVDLFNKHNLAIIGPNKMAAQLESSKSWAKSKMKSYGIPTADYECFSDIKTASDYVQSKKTYPIVLKADGLAAGKGVTIAHNEEEALNALTDCFVENKFKEAGHHVIIESFLKGQEVSVFAFTDGKTILPMVPAQDHKAIFDGDKGPNTGGMGAYSPPPFVSKELEERILKTVLEPLIQGFNQDDIDYTGIVYAGLMVDNNQINVVEFNVRFGDPETQVVLPQLDTDLIDIFNAMTTKNLDRLTLKWNNKPSVCVVLASKGYPGSYEKNKVITGLDSVDAKPHSWVIHAGTKRNLDHTIVTIGGRVLTIVSQGNTLESAIDNAYESVQYVHFDGVYYRCDIGHKALHYLENTRTI